MYTPSGGNLNLTLDHIRQEGCQTDFLDNNGSPRVYYVKSSPTVSVVLADDPTQYFTWGRRVPRGKMLLVLDEPTKLR